jgi:aryl-alcohol dehydrogenase-like predicted oxidoreductase
LKLALGTAQFGFDYGINNKKGKIPKKEVFQILSYAAAQNIDTLDTASSYGNSETVIGEYVKKNKADFKIVSKCPSVCSEGAKKILQQSLERLSLKKIYGYLIHNFNGFVQNPAFYSELRSLKEQGKIQKTGFSLYYPKEVDYLLEKKVPFDLLQVPYSVFDQRFTKLFPQLKQKNIEIHVRSVFLQGLVFKHHDELKSKLGKISGKLQELHALSEDMKIPVSALCINFALLNDNIDKVIVGVDDLKNLQENVAALRHQESVMQIYNRLLRLQEDDEQIILPFHWENQGKP